MGDTFGKSQDGYDDAPHEGANLVSLYQLSAFKYLF